MTTMEDELRTLLEKTAKEMKKESDAVAKRALTPVVDWEKAIIGTSSELGVTPVAQFAARIVETIEVRDDLNDPEDEKVELLHQLEVVTQSVEDNPQRTVHVIRGTVNDDDLGKPERWLKRFGAEVKSAGDNREGRFTDEAIGRAISAHARKSRRRVQRALLRTGWVEIDGHWHYVSHHNAITATGNTDAATSRLNANRQLRFVAPEGDDARQRAIAGFKYVTAALETPDQFNKGGHKNRTPGVATVGAICWTLAGFLTEHGVLVYTDMSAGKSTWLRPLVRSMMSGYAMLPSGSTGTLIGDAYRSLHQAPLIIDDVSREQSNKKEELSVEQGIDRLARVAYDGPEAAARGRMERSGIGGTYEQGVVDKAHPTFVMAGERIPQSGSLSGISRLFGAPFRGVNKAMAEDRESIGHLADFWGYFIQEVARRRDEDLDGFVADWQLAVETRAADNAAKYGSRFGSENEVKRRSRLLAVIQTGYELAVDILGISGEQWLAGDLALLEEAAVEYTSDTKVRRDDGTENVLELLRSKVATDSRYTTTGPQLSEVQNASVLARFNTIKAEDGMLDVVHIVPSVAIQALGWEPGAAANERLEKALKSCFVSGAAAKQRVSSGTASIKVHTIPLALWGSEADFEEEPANTAEVF
ncbi:MAG: hypothetical protein J0H96_13085 [Microbacterium ginsengisoli]|nr:hypothetical protein [Microbacterium ginsengisoli]